MQLQIQIFYLIMLNVTLNKMKADTIHKGQLLNIEKQSEPGMEHVGFC